MNPRVKEIISIEPFTIKALWSDGKVRMIDFGNFLSEFKQNEESHYYKILQKETFEKAKTDGRTIYWDNIAEMVDTDGSLIPGPWDFCPDVLFQNAVLLE